MTKRILSIIVSVVVIFSMSAVLVNAEDNAESKDVEISFKVGDSTLIINGNALTVETPYVAGAGTTLVPLRVITEAFGAEVVWINETKEIKLNYPDVNIILQIGNINATVNDHTEVLPEAPVLSPNGVTMVPLRFISETFGAEVSYDDITKAIKVIKKAMVENDTISASTDLPRIGDSYWGWSMMTPQGMMMTDRLTDGSITVFTDDEENILVVEFYKLGEDDDYDEDFKSLKENYSSYTLSRADKGTDEFGNKTYYFIARSKSEYSILYSVYTAEYCYDVWVVAEPSSEAIPTLTALVDSFKVQFATDDTDKSQTHDLSNVDSDGLRLVELEDLKISFKIPAEFVEVDDEAINKITYVTNDTENTEAIGVSVYSKTDTVTAESIAKKEKALMDKYYNKELIDVSPILPYETREIGENAIYMWCISENLIGGDFEFYNIYFEKGEYVYNIVIQNNSGNKKVFDNAMNSFEAEELDREKSGIFLYNEENEGSEEECSTGKWKMTIAAGWTELSETTSSYMVLAHNEFPASFIFTYLEGEYSFKDLQEITEVMANSSKEKGKLIEKVKKTDVGNSTYYTYTIRTIDEETGTALDTKFYVTIMRGNIYIFSLAEDEKITNAGTQADAEAMMASFKLLR